MRVGWLLHLPDDFNEGEKHLLRSARGSQTPPQDETRISK